VDLRTTLFPQISQISADGFFDDFCKNQRYLRECIFAGLLHAYALHYSRRFRRLAQTVSLMISAKISVICGNVFLRDCFTLTHYQPFGLQ